MLVRFRRWDEMLKVAEPPAELGGTRAVWTWARGMAFAATGKTDEAEAALNSFRAAEQSIPADVQFGLNKASDILKIADRMLAARISTARGERGRAAELLKEAVATEDGLTYDEPPAWFLPAREALGASLLADGRAAEAEAVFREDLKHNPRSGRSLFGLAESLNALHKTWAAAEARRQFADAWKSADTRLKLEDL